MLSTKVSWAFCESACSHFFIVSTFLLLSLHFLTCLFLSDCLTFMCMLLFFFPFLLFLPSFLCAFVVWMLWGVGRTTSQQVEGCLLLQNSMAFWEWDKAPPPPLKPPKKSFSACCLVCGGLSLFDRLKTFLTCP